MLLLKFHVQSKIKNMRLANKIHKLSIYFFLFEQIKHYDGVFDLSEKHNIRLTDTRLKGYVKCCNIVNK